MRTGTRADATARCGGRALRAGCARGPCDPTGGGRGGGRRRRRRVRPRQDPQRTARAAHRPPGGVIGDTHVTLREWRPLLAYARRYVKGWLVILLVTFASAALALAYPWPLKVLVD